MILNKLYSLIYFLNLSLIPSYFSASGKGSFFKVITGHFSEYLRLISTQSNNSSDSGNIASAGHSGTQTPQSIH